MKTAKTMMSLLLLSAVCVTPAYANWFSHAGTNTNLNIGSAPNPTPADLRRIGDSHLAGGVSFTSNVMPRPAFVAEPVAYGTPKHDKHVMKKTELTRMEGKAVFGAHGARLGSILAIDVDSRMAEVQTPGGIAVAMPASLLVDRGKSVTALTISPLDMMAMAKTQTGRTVAINVDRRYLRNSPVRG